VPHFQAAIKEGKPVTYTGPIKNVNRTACTILSSEVTRHHGAKGLPEDTIQLNLTGTAGQSIGAFAAPGVTIRVEGDVNDYCGKGLSGGKIIVFPPKVSSFAAEKNIIAGNVVLYGATAGEIYLSGIVGERFCVRNSGAKAVVEGVGDHGCEYMTGGVAVVLGETGRNFAAGMSGGIAYVYDEQGTFKNRVNKEMVDFDPLLPSDEKELLKLIRRHVEYTGSVRGKSILDTWEQSKLKIVKVMPVDYKRALAELQKEKEAASGKPAAELAEVSRG
jgi:glutamate synthase domain-containing protein 3